MNDFDRALRRALEVPVIVAYLAPRSRPSRLRRWFAYAPRLNGSPVVYGLTARGAEAACRRRLVDYMLANPHGTWT